MDARSADPRTGWVEMTKSAPETSSAPPSRTGAQADPRSLQIGEHTDNHTSREGGVSYVGHSWRCPSRVPWERFRRATSIPAWTSASTCPRVDVVGPSVHTILARRPRTPLVLDWSGAVTSPLWATADVWRTTRDRGEGGRTFTQDASTFRRLAWPMASSSVTSTLALCPV